MEVLIPVKPSGKSTLGVVLLISCVNSVSLFQSAELHAQGQIKGIYRFPEISIKEFQNAKFAGSVPNDHKVLLGSAGSDLWRGSTDATGEFWMVTDRGPNGQIRVDGANRRTFWVPEFNPTIVRVKLEGSAIKIVEAMPIVGRPGKPITGSRTPKLSMKLRTITRRRRSLVSTSMASILKD